MKSLIKTIIIIAILGWAFYFWSQQEARYCETFRGKPVEQTDQKCMTYFRKYR